MTKKFVSISTTLLALFLLTAAFYEPPAAESASGLQDSTVLIIRHSEKPETGMGLTPAGVRRAEEYTNYFPNLKLDSKPVKIDSLFAAADSKNSHRSRLTLEPLAAALGKKVNTPFKNKNFDDLVAELKSKEHGKTILIAWHHGEIPGLVKAFGADPTKLLPGGKWPENVFWWMIELHFDHAGHLIPESAKRINEKLMPGDTD